MTTNAPIESKVYAALIGGTVGTAATSLLLWFLGITFFDAPTQAFNDAKAIAAVPPSVANAVRLLVTLGCIGLGGYYAKHTPRLTDVTSISTVVPIVNNYTSTSPTKPDLESFDKPNGKNSTNYLVAEYPFSNDIEDEEKKS